MSDFIGALLTAIAVMLIVVLVVGFFLNGQDKVYVKDCANFGKLELRGELYLCEKL